MNGMYTREELLRIGVEPDNMQRPCGEMNIIVQSNNYAEENGHIYIMPDIYQPRKNSVWSYSCQDKEYIDLADENQKKAYIEHLRDSAERLKILSHKLAQQADEIEELGRPLTFVYYPE